MLTLKQIPGFSDMADTVFAAEKFAIGFNFQRIVDNAKFGMVRPEVFVGRYIDGDTVPLPTSLVDGYTYQRNELTYSWQWSLTGGTSASDNGNPSQPGAIRYMGAYVDQVDGTVHSTVNYLVGDGRGSTITNDGTLTVTVYATRRLASLVVATPPVYKPVLDSEINVDKGLTESLAQRMNDNAKFAAINTEIIYMGEFVAGDTVPRPLSPVDGYEYARSEVMFLGFWRWTTEGDQFVDQPANSNYKQIEDFSYVIDAASGAVGMQVQFYNSGVYNTSYGRLEVMAFCKRAMTPVAGSTTTQGLSGLGDGVVDFVDLSVDFLASGRAMRDDVVERSVQNTRYAICRTEFFGHGIGAYSGGGGDFAGTLKNGDIVPLPVSPIDGYQYSREELTYVYSYSSTFRTGASVRMSSWNCNIDQATGAVTSIINRVPQGGGNYVTPDGQLGVIVIARRDHVANASDVYIYDGAGDSGTDVSALLNGGFDKWYKSTDSVADDWALGTQTATGYGAQAPGLVSGFAQRLGSLASGDLFTIMSSRVTFAAGDLRYLGWVSKASGTGTLGLRIYFYDAVGDSVYSDLTSSTPIASIYQNYGWIQMPAKNDTAIVTSWGNMAFTGMLDFIPTACRIEYRYANTAAGYVDLDEVTFISQLDPSLGQIAQRGSNSLAYFPSIPFTVAATTFQPNLNFTIQRVDGTATAVAGGTPTTTGLTASTDYKWYPYYDEIAKIAAQVTTGGVGSPPNLHTAATRDLFVEWFAINKLPFSDTPIDITTLAAGAPPGGGYGGGDNGCIRSDQYVKEMNRGVIQAADVRVGMRLLSSGGRYLEVHDCVAALHDNWVAIKFSHGGTLVCTAGHPFQNTEGKVIRAWDMGLNTVLEWENGVCSPTAIVAMKKRHVKVKITLEAPHVFYAGQTKDHLTLTHNYSLPPGGTL